ncbi:NUDIX domain-containing protein [Paenibacillus sp. F6_3S_P_1C]|uniref:NUDIX domain-containing protein n=1 Tax=Paenibacillus vandeheii TaxID=3035917 RepID=A0ABT8JE14_9BACL|nr:NUDIX domain-containing protein [Paenibacillus vandeheii]MDN4602732.1 NUDIX domain-containing protein [Paenibacillus vandeheii]
MTPERFDIYDDQQNWIGTELRSVVHAKGFWHRSFHCWIVRDEGSQRWVLFQRRRDIKDTFPGCYDITAAGHLTAGEQLHEASRELEEELGVQAPFETLTYLLTARQQLEGQVRGVPFLDREFSSVYGLCLNQPLEAYTLQASEVDSLYEVPLDELIALFRGETQAIQAAGVPAVQAAVDQANGTSLPLPVQTRHIREIQAAEFVPHGTEYYIDVLEALYNLPIGKSNPA